MDSAVRVTWWASCVPCRVPEPVGSDTQQEGQAASRPRSCAPVPALRPRTIGRGNGGRARKRAGGGAGAPAPAVRASPALIPLPRMAEDPGRSARARSHPSYLPQRTLRTPALQCPPRAADRAATAARWVVAMATAAYDNQKQHSSMPGPRARAGRNNAQTASALYNIAYEGSCGTCMRTACRVSGALRTAARAPRKLAAAVSQQPPLCPGQPSPPARTLLGAAPPAAKQPWRRRRTHASPTAGSASGSASRERCACARLRLPCPLLPYSRPESGARAHAAPRSGRTHLRPHALPYTAAPRRGEGASAGAGALAAPAGAGPAWRAPPPRRRAAAVGAGGA
jgi:hypothetical protein